MTHPTRTDIVKTLAAGTLTALLATAIVAVPAMVPNTPLDGAAYAKGKSDDKGNRGNGNGNRDRGAEKSKGSKDKRAKSSGGGFKNKSGGQRSASARGNGPVKAVRDLFKPKKAKTSKQARPAKPAPEVAETEVVLTKADLGRWNANPSPNALAAQTRNAARKGWNGSTVSMLAQVELTARAMEIVNCDAEPCGALEDSLTETELAALEKIEGYGTGEESDPITDADLESLLNDGAGDDDPLFELMDGSVECVARCPEDEMEKEALEADAQDLIDLYSGAMAGDATKEAVEGAYETAIDQLISNGNKSYETEAEQEALVAEVSEKLGVEVFDIPN